jgi:hypothetical protein
VWPSLHLDRLRDLVEFVAIVSVITRFCVIIIHAYLHNNSVYNYAFFGEKLGSALSHCFAKLLDRLCYDQNINSSNLDRNAGFATATTEAAMDTNKTPDSQTREQANAEGLSLKRPLLYRSSTAPSTVSRPGFGASQSSNTLQLA